MKQGHFFPAIGIIRHPFAALDNHNNDGHDYSKNKGADHGKKEIIHAQNKTNTSFKVAGGSE
jgi:hypothetical protein